MKTPVRIWQLYAAHWATAALAAAVKHAIFTHIERGGDTAERIAREAGLPLRGVQALLDGLAALDLVVLRDGRYSNSEDASEFLVEGRPRYFGHYAKIILGQGDGSMQQWSRLAEAVQTGKPIAAAPIESYGTEFWKDLVLAIMPVMMPIADLACRTLRFAEAGAVTVLDIGGGSGVYSALMLKANPLAKSIQIDWPNVNAVAREFVASFGVGSRFSTIDGDLETMDFTSMSVDYVILSNIAHHLSPEANIALLQKIRKALKTGGTLIVSEMVLNDGRTGPPFELLFNLGMLIQTQEGASYRRQDICGWLAQTGFSDVSVEPTGTPSTLIYAR